MNFYGTSLRVVLALSEPVQYRKYRLVRTSRSLAKRNGGLLCQSSVRASSTIQGLQCRSKWTNKKLPIEGPYVTNATVYFETPEITYLEVIWANAKHTKGKSSNDFLEDFFFRVNFRVIHSMQFFTQITTIFQYSQVFKQWTTAAHV
jgi:hypothetical protein